MRSTRRVKLNENNFKYISQFFNKMLMLSIVFSLIILVDIKNSNSFVSYTSIKNYTQEHMNILSIVKIYNNDFSFSEEDTEEVDYDYTKFEDYEDFEDGILLRNQYDETVSNIVEGVVVRKYNNSLVIKSIDGNDYYYENIDDIKVSLYEYINTNQIIGLSLFNDEIEKFEFYLKVKNRNSIISVKEVLGIV